MAQNEAELRKAFREAQTEVERLEQEDASLSQRLAASVKALDTEEIRRLESRVAELPLELWAARVKAKRAEVAFLKTQPPPKNPFGDIGELREKVERTRKELNAAEDAHADAQLAVQRYFASQRQGYRTPNPLRSAEYELSQLEKNRPASKRTGGRQP
jgi:chromosome segregation ATPase